MTDPRNDLVEDLLQERFQGPVADDGFSMRVMEHLRIALDSPDGP